MVEGAGEERSQANRPTIFISYASQDAALANAVVGVLERAGLACWIAPRDVEPGALYAGEIVRAINESSLVVLVLSAQSVTSTHVGKELERASSKRRRIIALRTDAAVLPDAFEYFLSESHWIEVGPGGIEPAATKLAEAARRHLGTDRESPPATLAHTHSSVPQKRPPKAVILGVAALFFVALSAAAAWKLHLGRTTTAAPPITEASSSPRTSVAVMPFANLTGDASKEYLGDGMGEELIDALAKVPGLKVPSRTSSFAYKGRHADLKQIASDLHVGTILEGSVRSAGETIRISAELIDAQTDTHLWSDSYDRKFTDLFKLQDDLAMAIVQAMQVNLHGSSPVSVAQAPPTQDVEAYRLYLQGVSVYSRFSEKEMRDGIALLKQALDRDPGFARAWADLGIAHLGAVRGGYPLPNALQDAEQEATRALALDPGLVNGSLVLGSVSAYRGDWIKADALYEAAIARDGGNPIIRYARANDILESVGHLRLALEEANVAYRLAPVDTSALVALSAVHSIAGHDAEAIHYLDLLLQIGFSPDVTPLPQIRANALTRSGRYREAGERMLIVQPARMREAGGDVVIRAVYAALGEPRKKPSAVAALQALLKKLKADDIDVNARKALIATFVQLDALDEAFQLANQTLDFFARSNTVGSAWGVLWLPEMRPFRRDPRFQPFVTRMGLMEYWKQYGPPDDCDLKDGKLTCH
jgi:TolB-like protein